MTLEHRPGPDPAYQGVPPAAAFAFGPQLLRARHPLLVAELTERLAHVRRSPHRRAELERLEDALTFCKQGA